MSAASAHGLSTPVAVFDAGIGSYALVDLIRRRQPSRDIVYFADRARFPYGRKTRDELLPIMRDTIGYLLEFQPEAIVLASNAPSIMVLDALKDEFGIPVHGVSPPLAKALALSENGRAGIMGVQSMIESDELAQYVRAHAPDSRNVALVNGSSMVDLVESGAFLLQPGRTAAEVAGFCDRFSQAHPGTSVFTLSSTHLPWLRPFFEKARPEWRFLDPAEDVVSALPQPAGGAGKILALVTESPAYTVSGFRAMLEKLGVSLPLTLVDPPIG